MQQQRRHEGKLDKKILTDYIDACKLVEETGQDIKKLREKRRTIVQTNVKGSMPDFPYAEQHFRIEGTTFTYGDDSQLRWEEKLLQERKAKAEQTKMEVLAYMNTIPMRMQRIIRYKYFEGYTWKKTAEHMGKKATENGLKKEFERFLENN